MSIQTFRDKKFYLNKLFFNYEFNINVQFSKLQIDEFWLFLEKYLEKKKKQKTCHDDPIKYDKLIQKLTGKIPEEWINIDKLREESHLKDINISLAELKEFRNILLIFVDFNLKRKEKKLIKKLTKINQTITIFFFG